MARLGEICEILDSKRVPITATERHPGPYPYYGANGVQDYVADYIFDDDLVLLAEDGGNFGSKDKPIAYRISGKCWVNNHAHVLKPKEGLDVDYLCYSLMFYDVTGLVNGATRQKLTQADMRKMEIPLPPLEEQHKIAAVLDKISDLIAKRRQQLDKLDEMVKSRFIEMFGDVTKNEKNWSTRKISEIATLQSGGTPSRQFPKYFEGTIPWITTVALGKNAIGIEDAIEYITEEAIENSATKLIPKNSLLFGIRVGVGKVSENIVPMCINQDVVAIIINDRYKLNMLFLKNLLDMFSGYFNSQKRGATIQGIKSEVLKNISVSLPPIELQNQFADFVKQTDKSKYFGMNGIKFLWKLNDIFLGAICE